MGFFDNSICFWIVGAPPTNNPVNSGFRYVAGGACPAPAGENCNNCKGGKEGASPLPTNSRKVSR